MGRNFQNRHYLVEAMLRWEVIPDRTVYPYNLPAVRGLDGLRFHPAVSFFVGENGSGKSTILEALAMAWGFGAEGGTLNFSPKTRATHSELHDRLRLSRGMVRPFNGFFLRAESFYNVASAIEDYGAEESYGGVSLHEMSHGEAFFALFMNRFGGEGLYILDEPEAALSPMRQMAMLSRLHELVREGGQFIIATHSPILTAYPDAQIFELGETGIERRAYQETELYRTYRDFLARPNAMLRILMSSDDDETDP